jgi:putative SOS response-associated peptidase YedK
MPVDEAPDDNAVRETYNFAPGNFGVVYRADVYEKGRSHAGQGADVEHQPQDLGNEKDDVSSEDKVSDDQAVKYKLQSMKWGLVPFWTKRQPDYGSTMRTINCRDDSLIEDSGMWTTMKRRKRCIVICQGFYEWLKKGPGGKEKIPHFVRRKDGELMCFAGLWDCVSYEGESQLLSYEALLGLTNTLQRF